MTYVGIRIWAGRGAARGQLYYAHARNFGTVTEQVCSNNMVQANMKRVVETLFILLLVLTCIPRGNTQGFLNQQEIDRIQLIIENNQLYPVIPEGSANKALVFGLIMSFGGNIDSSGAVPGVRVALDRINNDSNLLPGYTLHYALSDSRVSQSAFDDVVML